MSFKAQVRVVNDANWYDNELRFATLDEATQYGSDLCRRWSSTTGYRTIQCDQDANCSFVEGKVLWDGSKRTLDEIEEGSD